MKGLIGVFTWTGITAVPPAGVEKASPAVRGRSAPYVGSYWTGSDIIGKILTVGEETSACPSEDLGHRSGRLGQTSWREGWVRWRNKKLT